MTPKRPPIIGITAGDPNGIGPEVALKAAWAEKKKMQRTLLIGHRSIWERTAAQLSLPLPPEVEDIRRAAAAPPVATWNPDMAPAPRYAPGRVRADAARAAYSYILATVAAAQNGFIDGMVTAPINKEGFQKAGILEPGHTELIARLTGTRRYGMMLFGQRIRVVLATRHLPLRRVADALTQEAVWDAIELLHTALPWMGFPQARIGVCGLNPHAGDGGALGHEEQTIIAPVIATCRKKKWAVQGPIPADAIFHQHLAGEFDAVVAMYHDQGLAPMKMISFEDGVNLTLGLPLIRTSPDHGTAYALAGRNQADASSMRSALRWARQLAARPNPWA